MPGGRKMWSQMWYWMWTWRRPFRIEAWSTFIYKVLLTVYRTNDLRKLKDSTTFKFQFSKLSIQTETMLFLNRLFLWWDIQKWVHTYLDFLNIQNIISLVTGFWGIIVDSTMFMLIYLFNSHSYVTKDLTKTQNLYF